MPTIDPIFVLAARWATAALFAAAAWEKLRHPLYFQANLREYDLLPGALVAPVARTLPVVEFIIAMGVLVPATAGTAALGAATLLALYALAMGVNLLRGRRDIDCGCTGPAMRQTLTGWLVARNAALVAVALTGAAVPAGRAIGAADLTICALVVAAGAVLYGAVNQLTSNVPRLDALDAWMEQP